MSYNDILNEITDILQKFYDTKKNIFIPNETPIRVAEPTYDWKEIKAVIECLLTTNVTMGKKVEQFEKVFAEYVGVKHAIMVNSGSSANLLSLKIMTSKLLTNYAKKNGEVITPAVNWSTTVFPIVDANLIPVFVDVNLGTYDISTKELENAISDKTEGIVLVHLLGIPCDMDKITKLVNNSFLIEDCCEAIGSKFLKQNVGSFGDVGTYSFYFSHHISTIEGGMLVTNRDDVKDLAKSMRSFGWSRNNYKISSYPTYIDPAFLFIMSGYNFRPMDIQAAMGLLQMEKLSEFLNIRNNNAKYWNKKFSQYKDIFILPKEKKGTTNSNFCYPLTIQENPFFDRSDLIHYLNNNKIETRPIMSGNMVEQPVMKNIKYKTYSSLKNSKLIMRNGFFFGNHQNIGPEEREYIANVIDKFMAINLKK